jgi:hypothetical protein
MDACSLPYYEIGGAATEKPHNVVFRALIADLDSRASALSGTDRELIEGVVRRGKLRGLLRTPDASLSSLYDDPKLFFSQCCGQMVYEDAHKRATLHVVGAPIFTAAVESIGNCPDGYYNSCIVAHVDNEGVTDMPASFTSGLMPYAGGKLGGLCGATLAVNGYDSYSGCTGIANACALVCGPQEQPCNIFFHPDVQVTGGHRESVAAVRHKKADVYV